MTGVSLMRMSACCQGRRYGPATASSLELDRLQLGSVGRCTEAVSALREHRELLRAK
jgi:hypothetical protein